MIPCIVMHRKIRNLCQAVGRKMLLFEGQVWTKVIYWNLIWVNVHLSMAGLQLQLVHAALFGICVNILKFSTAIATVATRVLSVIIWQVVFSQPQVDFGGRAATDKPPCWQLLLFAPLLMNRSALRDISCPLTVRSQHTYKCAVRMETCGRHLHITILMHMGLSAVSCLEFYSLLTIA